MDRFRKGFIVSVMAITVISMSMLTVPMFHAHAAAQAGDLIKMDGLSSVYYLGADGKRYVFPNETTYFSWYSDFSNVMTISQSELESYPLGANVTIRPGTDLVKITTNPNVYAVTPGGNLVLVPDEATASALYGADWAKRVVDVPDSFFTNYTITGNSVSSTAYPAGSLIKLPSSSDVYYINTDGTASKIADEASFNANRFSFNNVITTAAGFVLPTLGTDITGAMSTLTDTSEGAGGTPGAGTGLTVALSGTTAPSSTIIAGQAIANLASFNFTASNDGDVTVTTLRVKRVGVSADTTLTNVYLYDGMTKLTDASTPSSGYMTFSNPQGIFTVAAGTTMTVTVKSDIEAGTTGQTVGVELEAASDVTTNGASVSGSFPVNGNLMGISSASDLATVAVGTLTSAPSTINAGTLSATVWSAPFTISNKSVTLDYVSFRQIGSVNADDLQNLTLYINGVQAGDVLPQIGADNRANFDLTANPVVMDTGVKTVELRADIVKGSGRTFSFSLQTASDIVVLDNNYNVNVAATNLPKTTVSSTISNGSISVSVDPTFDSTQIVKNATNAVLARYTMKAYGENMKIQTLTVIPTFTYSTTTASLTPQANEGLQNIAIYVNGSQVGSSKNYVASAAGAANLPSDPVFGTTNLFTINAGDTATIEIRGDLKMNTTSYISTVNTELEATAGAYQGLTSFTTSPATDTTYTGTPALSVITGALSLSASTNFQSQTVVGNVTQQKIGSYTIQAGNAESVRVSNIAIAIHVNGMTLTNLNNLYISENTTPVIPQATNNFPVNFTLTPNTYKTIDVYADIGNITSGAASTTMTVTATGADTGNSLGGSIAGQTITVGSGSLAVPTLVSSNYPSKLVEGGQTVGAATYKFVATNGAATIQEMKINVTNAATSSANGTAINSITIGSVIAPVVCANSVCQADVTGLNISVPAGSTGYQVDVQPTYNTVTSAGQGGSLTRNISRLNLVYYKYKVGSNTHEVNTNVASNQMLLVASVPTVVAASDNPAGVGTGYAAGANSDVLHFTVTATNNPINLKQVGFTPVYVGNLSSTTQQIKIYAQDDMNTVLGQANIGAKNTQGHVTFTDDYVIPANTTKEFVVKVDTTGLTGSGDSFRIDLTANDDTGVSTGTDWQWNDSTAATYGNGYLIKNLPVTGNTFVHS